MEAWADTGMLDVHMELWKTTAADPWVENNRFFHAVSVIRQHPQQLCTQTVVTRRRMLMVAFSRLRGSVGAGGGGGLLCEQVALAEAH